MKKDSGKRKGRFVSVEDFLKLSAHEIYTTLKGEKADLSYITLENVDDIDDVMQKLAEQFIENINNLSTTTSKIFMFLTHNSEIAKSLVQFDDFIFDFAKQLCIDSENRTNAVNLIKNLRPNLFKSPENKNIN